MVNTEDKEGKEWIKGGREGGNRDKERAENYPSISNSFHYVGHATIALHWCKILLK